MFFVAIDMLGAIEKHIENGRSFLSNKINHIPVLKYHYLGSFPFDHVPTLENDTFAIINAQSAIYRVSIRQGLQGFVILCILHTLGGRKKYCFVKQF